MTITETDRDAVEMSGQKYKRTNFEDDDNTSTGGTPPGVTYDPAIAFKVGASFWQKRSCLEKALFPVIVALCLVVVILAALLAARDGAHHVPSNDTLCTTPVCVTVASSIITAMDDSVDPCDDFYQYACGGWIKSHPIPVGQSRWGTFGVMWQENQIVMKNVIEQPLEKAGNEAERKAMTYYRSCMDENKTIERLGAAPLLDFLREMGGWNITSRAGAWDGSNWRLQDALEHLHSLELSVLFSTWVAVDEKDTTKNILQIDQSGLVLGSRDQYVNKTIQDDKILRAYLKYMGDIGELLGADRNASREQMIQVIEFEQRLANITIPSEDRRDDEKLYHKMTIAELQKMAPVFNWQHYFNQLLSITSYRVKASEELIVLAPEYFEQMSELVRSMDQTEEGRTTLHNYMMWYLVGTFSSYLSKPFKEARKSFNEVLTGVTGNEEKWRMCVSDTDSILGFALGAMFVREAFHGNSKEKAEEMIEEIKTAFKHNLPKLSWMDDETRRSAIGKLFVEVKFGLSYLDYEEVLDLQRPKVNPLKPEIPIHKTPFPDIGAQYFDYVNAVVDMIGFPPYILNSTQLDERYVGLAINEDTYFENNVHNLLHTMKRSLNKLRKVPDKYSWSMTPPTVNAYYAPTKNEIVFPAGVLQAPFYDRNYPKSLNFGGIGVVMGHELTHGFDDSGREYDKDGILRPWWNKDVVEKFKEQAQCMVDQYSGYTVNGEHVRGKQTLGESIADNGGLKAAYMAYEDWVRRNGPETPLPGTNLTHRQLFFVSFAQVWCSRNTPQSEHLSLLFDEHPPAKYRVIGTLSNSVEFSDQFQCSKGARMNPGEKCEVW